MSSPRRTAALALAAVAVALLAAAPASAAYRFVSAWGSEGRGGGEFGSGLLPGAGLYNSPGGVAVDARGSVFVAVGTGVSVGGSGVTVAVGCGVKGGGRRTPLAVTTTEPLPPAGNDVEFTLTSRTTEVAVSGKPKVSRMEMVNSLMPGTRDPKVCASGMVNDSPTTVPPTQRKTSACRCGKRSRRAHALSATALVRTKATSAPKS